MAPQAKRMKIGKLSNSGHLEGLCTPVSKSGSSKFKQVRSKKTENGLSQLLALSPKVCSSSNFNSTLEPGLAELFCEPVKSSSKSTKKGKSKTLSDKSCADSPCISDLLEMSTKKPKTPQPNTVGEVFEKYMEQDPFASIWDFIPREKRPLPDKRPLTFFSPPKERHRTPSVPRNPIHKERTNTESVGNCEETADSSENADPLAKKGVSLCSITPIYGKRLGTGAYSPCSSAGRNFSRINCSTWSGLNNSNGSNYSPAPSCSTPSVDPFKTPADDAHRQSWASGFPLSGVKALFRDRSFVADSPADTPSRTDSFGAVRNLSPVFHHDICDRVKGNILLGVTCFVDCKYNNEDRAKYVQKECIALGAKVEKNFTKKVTHVVFKGGKMSTYIKAKESNIPLVSLLWLEACKTVGTMVDPARYPPTDDEKYQKERPIEEAKRRERFFKRGRDFLDRLNGVLPPKPKRTRSGNKGRPISATEKKTKAKISRPVLEVVPDKGTKVHKKLNFNQPGPSTDKNRDSGDSDYVSESDPEEGNGEAKRRRSAPADIAVDGPSESGGQRKLTKYFSKLPKVKQPGQNEQSKPKCRSPERTPKKELLKVLTGGFTTTADKKKRKLFDPNQSLMSQPLPTTPVELSPYVKDSPHSKRSGSRCRTASSKKPSSRSKTTSSKAKHRFRETKRLVTARKSLVTLMEQKEEEEDAMATSRNSLACFDLTRKGKLVAPKCQPRIAFTSLPKEDVMKYKKIISRLGNFEVDLSVTKKTTHLLTSTPVKRTVNLLKALARGCWILDVQWLIHSEQSGKWMSEEPFEQKSFSEAVTASRLEKQAFGKDYSMDLFSDCGPIFVDSDVQPTRLDLTSLLKICCAKVVSVSSNAAIIISNRPLDEQNSQVDVVRPQWILDSITHNKRMDLAEYTT